ncbi:MAG: type II toxin-antitoxin system VapB family antitoxin [Verrucomicrobiales bacterium]
MKTTIDIPDRLLEDVMEYAGAKTKRAAVITALEDFQRRQRVQRFLIEAAGSMPDFPTNDEVEAADMEYEERMRRLWNREEA